VQHKDKLSFGALSCHGEGRREHEARLKARRAEKEPQSWASSDEGSKALSKEDRDASLIPIPSPAPSL